MASRAALVTGGSSGIGKALARVLGEEGYALTIAGRDEAKLAAAAEQLSGDGGGRRAPQGAGGERLVPGGQGRHAGNDVLRCGKAGVNALTESAQAETRNAGIQFTIFSPGFTATPMAQWTRAVGVAAEEMVQPSDLGEGLRFLLRTSPTCLVREIEFTPPAQREIIERLVAHRSRAAAGE